MAVCVCASTGGGCLVFLLCHQTYLHTQDFYICQMPKHNATIQQRACRWNRESPTRCIFKFKNILHVYVITGEARPKVNKSEVYQRLADTSWRCKTTKLFYYYSPFSKDYSKKTDKQVTPPLVWMLTIIPIWFCNSFYTKPHCVKAEHRADLQWSHSGTHTSSGILG